MEYVKKIISNAAKIKDKLALVKLPSYTIKHPKLLKEFINDISILTACGAKLFIVHEYEDLIKKKLQDLNLTKRIDESQNMSPEFLNNRIIELYEIIISGYISKFLVRSFNKYSVTSMGISGKDGNLIVTDKPTRYSSQENKNNRLICDVAFVNPEIIFAFEPMSILTVISPIAVDKNGHTSIANVDDMIAKIATSAGFDYVIYVENEIKKESMSSEINSYQDLKVATTKMRLNSNLIRSAESILQNIPANIYFIDADIPHPIVSTLIAN